MLLSSLDNVLWAASLVGHAALFVVLVYRKRFLRLPVFSAFAIFEALRTILLFVVYKYGTRHGYFLAYWISGGVDYVFQVALVFEVALDVLRPTGLWVLDSRRYFLRWGTAGLIMSAAVAMMMGPPQAKGLDLWDVRITVFTSMLTCQLFLAMTLSANRLMLRWSDPAVAVAQGLSLWALIALIEDLGHVALGWNHHFVFLVNVRMFAYLAMLGYWITVFWLPYRKEAKAPTEEQMAMLMSLHQQVQSDIETLKGYPRL